MVKRGRVAIVGPENVKDILVPEFLRRFSTVVFFTPGNIKLSVEKTISVTSGKFNLAHFDYILLLPESSEKEFYYILARILEKKTKVSIPSDSLLDFWNRPILLNKLSGVAPIRKTASVSQHVAADFIKNEFKLPVILTTPGGKRVYVSNEETLRNVLSLFSAGHMVSVHKPIKKAEVYVTFISERDVIGYYRIGDKRVHVNLDSKLAEIGQNIRTTLGADFCSALFVKIGKKYYLSNVKLLPKFEIFKKVLGKDLASVMAEEASRKIAPFDIANVFDNVFKGIGGIINRFAGWMDHEVSNTRSSK
ncbi:MAG: hypothetical protein GOV01_02945 [Candidatus Altiarchaeota archaeon]|nr:hypothetical protein [Candidatus Altiarchaeota archaeon]